MTCFRKLNLAIKQDIPLSAKYIITVISLLIVPTVVASLVFFVKIQSVIDQEIGRSYEQVVNQYITSVTNKIISYNDLLNSISSNGVLLEILNNQSIYGQENAVELGKKVSKEIDMLISTKPQNEIYGIMLYALDRDFPRDGKYISNIELIKEEFWYPLIENTDKPINYFSYKTDGSKTNLLSFAKQIRSYNIENLGKELGFVKLDLSPSYIFSSGGISQPVRAMGDICIVDENYNLLYNDNHSGFQVNKEHLKDIFKNDAVSGKEVIKFETTRRILVYNTIQPFNWRVIVLFPDNEVSRKVSEIISPILWLMVLLLFLMIGATLLYSRLFSQRTSRLVKKMKTVVAGNLDMENYDIIEGSDEIGTIDKSFNEMLRQLKQSIDETYLQKIQKREAELKALKMQINPHFLHNTLGSISSIAATHNCRDICAICEKLGAIFRYNMNNNPSDYVTVRQEIEHIKNYLFIQKVRFGDKIISYIDLPKGLEECATTHFILQPIVENAFQHGFAGNCVGGCIELSVYEKNDTLFIRIQDDGVGMSSEQLKALEHSMNSTEEKSSRSDGSIGMRNVNLRIKLLCGEPYGISVQSRIDFGTSVIISQPLRGYNEEENNV